MGLCLSRVGFATIFTTYSAALPLLKQDWGMSASEAGIALTARRHGAAEVTAACHTDVQAPSKVVQLIEGPSGPEPLATMLAPRIPR